MNERPNGPFELRLTPVPIHVATARLFVASLGRAVGLSETEIDDVRLATSEIVSAAIVAGEVAEIVLAGETFDGGLSLSITPATPGSQSDDRFDVESIVTALFPEARFENGMATLRAGGNGA